MPFQRGDGHRSRHETLGVNAKLDLDHAVAVGSGGHGSLAHVFRDGCDDIGSREGTAMPESAAPALAAQ